MVIRDIMKVVSNMEKINSIITLSNKAKMEIRSNYMKSLENKAFKEVVASLDASDELLMKYTSTLMDAAVEMNNCKNCSLLEECKNKVRGSYLSPKKNDNRISFLYSTCHFAEKELYKDNVVLFDVPKAIRNASVKDIYTDDKNRIEVIKYIKDYITDYNKDRAMKALYLHGSFGSGKTYLVAALFNELAKKGVKSIIIHVPELIRSIKDSFDTDYSDRFHTLKTTPLLLLDDIGAEYLTEWARDEVIEPILQYRMDEGLPTFFTSNFTLEDLEKHFATNNSGIEKVSAKRILERIKQLSHPIQLVSKNRRD